MGSTHFGENLGFYGSGFGVGSSSGGLLVLDGERGELVMRRAEKRGVGGGGFVGSDSGLDPKAAMALKSHSEAEKRRRERINGHLATLRDMVPCTDKVVLLFPSIFFLS